MLIILLLLFDKFLCFLCLILLQNFASILTTSKNSVDGSWPQDCPHHHWRILPTLCFACTWRAIRGSTPGAGAGPWSTNPSASTFPGRTEPEEDPEIIEIEDDEEEEANGGEQPPSPPPVAAAEDVPPPPMGWTVKIYHKARGDVVSHHRLVGMLSA
jgi:hypothetical protein